LLGVTKQSSSNPQAGLLVDDCVDNSQELAYCSLGDTSATETILIATGVAGAGFTVRYAQCLLTLFAAMYASLTPLGNQEFRYVVPKHTYVVSEVYYSVDTASY